MVKVFHGSGNFAAVVLDQGGGAAADGFGLGAEEAGGADEVLQHGQGNFGKVPGRPAAGKEGGGDLIDPCIGALGGEDGGDEELERVGMIQLAMGGGVGAFELGDDLAGAVRKKG